MERKMNANQSTQIEFNKKLQNNYLEHAVINDVIRKYLDNKSSNHSDDHLYRNKGEHALLRSNDEYLYSITNVSSVNCKAENPDPTTKNNYKQTTMQSYPCKNKCTYKVHLNQLQSVTEIKLTSNDKIYVDKTTFCRPVLNLYNEQFIFKTMERNARLRNLVKKLAIARQREKEDIAWNNFINELKNKHGTSDLKYSCKIYDDARENIAPEIINDLYNTKFSFNKQSRLCENLLEDFYHSCDTSQPNSTYCTHANDSKIIESARNYKFVKYGENLYCYPTSSLGRLIMIDKEKRKKKHLNNWGKHVSDRNLPVYSGNRGSCLNKKKFKLNTNFIKTSAVQTDYKPIPDFIQNIYQDKATNNTRESDKTQWPVKQEPDEVLEQNSLESIEKKLETLIESISKFIDEIKINKKLMKDNSFRSEISNDKSKELNTKIYNLVPSKMEKTVPRVDTDNCGNVENMSTHNASTLCTVAKVCGLFPTSASETIRVPHAYHASNEEPTRDCTTEITQSFLKYNDANKSSTIEEINTLNHKQFPYQQNMTIAVNTDPLSILALLRVSTDTFKSILSYIPNFNYYSYLSMLPIPHSVKTTESHYVCNICGADFSKPSELSNHIPEHNLGKTRDCCVCRLVLDRVRRQHSLFRCKYCGQCFTRAYCCELHQNSCAKQMGRNEDVSSDLLLLR